MIFDEYKREAWKGLSFDVPSKGVIACDDHGNGCVLFAVGAHLRFEMEEVVLHTLSDLGLDDAPKGISVWEGHYVWQPGGGEDPQGNGSMLPSGAFRAPTEEEWQAIQVGRCPWPESESGLEVEG